MNLIELPGGDLFASDAQALVNPVNTVGVMGKGLALEFKKRYPNAAKEYFLACARKEHRLEVGIVLVCREGAQFVIHFPTKIDWRAPSRIGYIDAGLYDLCLAIQTHSIKSIAIPALGCGLGGLPWEDVRNLIVGYLAIFDITVYIYPPGEPS
jgi:O-acetyl-ADP-ribose deacetylase (regulator of RNase III)